MNVFEYMIIEAGTGVEKRLCYKITEGLKTEKELLAICGVQVLRKAFLTTYKLFHKIENLPKEEKKELKDFVIKNFPGKPKEELIENCKIIYTAGKLIK